MIKTPFNNFPADEIEDFNSVCIKFKLNSSDFLVFAEIEESQSEIHSLKRFVTLTYIKRNITKKYYAGHISNWTYEFEKDVANNLFLR